MNIGFVGIGRMGANMARRLHERGFHVTTLFDSNRTAATTLAQEIGATACPTVGEVTAVATVIFNVVSDDAAMHAVFSGADNLLAKATGKLYLNCTTLSPRVH